MTIEGFQSRRYLLLLFQAGRLLAFPVRPVGVPAGSRLMNKSSICVVGAEARGWGKLAQDGPLTKHQPAAQTAGIDRPGKGSLAFHSARAPPDVESMLNPECSYVGILGSSVTLLTPNKVTAMVLSEDLRGGRRTPWCRGSAQRSVLSHLSLKWISLARPELANLDSPQLYSPSLPLSREEDTTVLT